jgi:single-stranded DNA-binding protein
LRTRKWTDNAGLTKYSTEVIVTHFIFLDSKSNGEDENIHMEDTHTMDTMIDEEVPF